MGVGEPGDPFGGGGEQHPVPGLTGPDRDADRQVSLAGARRAEEDDVIFGDDEVQWWEMVSRLSPRAWSKSNSSNDFRDGNGLPGCGPHRRVTPGRRPRAADTPPGTLHGSRTRRGPARPAG